MTSMAIENHTVASSSRRTFLKFTASAAIGGGLMLGFGLPARSEVRDTLTTDAPFAPDAFLRIDRAGKVTFVMPVIEMGQGTYTSLPMLIAEELEVDVDKVAIEHSPPDDKVYANPLIGLQLTGGSTSVRGAYVPLRRAGATARVMLVNAAAQQWSVDPSTCDAEKGVVVHKSTGRKLGYGQLG
jgi:isoquinoline 1-oxidoreductase beta subunit